mmetsp:Transcript_86928/g.153707  ORF Transcript_86928/g.153707 Transcript_86928/m.153707 type:complete len:267 (+) Transcript_86928:753-1553(+)
MQPRSCMPGFLGLLPQLFAGISELLVQLRRLHISSLQDPSKCRHRVPVAFFLVYKWRLLWRVDLKILPVGGPKQFWRGWVYPSRCLWLKHCWGCWRRHGLFLQSCWMLLWRNCNDARKLLVVALTTATTSVGCARGSRLGRSTFEGLLQRDPAIAVHLEKVHSSSSTQSHRRHSLRNFGCLSLRQCSKLLFKSSHAVRQVRCTMDAGQMFVFQQHPHGIAKLIDGLRRSLCGLHVGHLTLLGVLPCLACTTSLLCLCRTPNWIRLS